MAGYGSLEGWRAYALARGDSAPTSAPDVDAQAALLRASDHVRYRYVANLLPGLDETLEVVEPATYVAASLELATPGFFSRTYTPGEQKVLTQVEGIKWTVVGDASKSFAAAPTSTLIDAMFAPFLIDRDVPGFMLRAVGG
ncbi:hypothetical protein [Phenylobacterium sp.]|uniref:hypothetical protein n=1 Tax=Phenylobacterium sp. TaxID=1871053 RepID=UPI0027318411|nr:hypothetical protein [Phenylobacterium sp.]MDP1599013.1 hypothetical protein [Phenylobacterium sp.]MDP3590441.1 hypothetical protein [Phenylobacterium sp.]